jgi:hypothetical protein
MVGRWKALRDRVGRKIRDSLIGVNLLEALTRNRDL